MKVSRLIALVFFIEIASLAVVAFFFLRPVIYTEYQGDGFTCLVPADSQVMVFEEQEWHKHHFTGKGTLYISHRALKGTFEEEVEQLGKHLQGAVFQQEIEIFEDGWFFLFAGGKSWRKYIYLFSVGQEVFWVENLSRYSTLLTYKEVVDRVVATLNVHGRDSNYNLPIAIKDINRGIVRYSQSPVLFFSLMAAIMLGLLVFIAGLFSFAGSMPSLDPGQMVIRQEKWVYVTIRGPWKYKGTTGALVLTTEALTLYYFRRPMMTLSRGDIEKISLGEKKGKSFLMIQEDNGSFQIQVADARLWMSEITSQLGSM